MTRIELLREIKALPRLVAMINENESKNYTNCKTEVLERYFENYQDLQAPQPPVSEPVQEKELNDFDHAFENAALAFLAVLEQKGVLDYLLVKVKG